MPINKWMDKQNVVYPYNRTLLNKKKQITDTLNKMEESQILLLSEGS